MRLEGQTVSSPGVLRTVFALLADLLRLLTSVFHSRAQLAAENLFLRKQLACYLERQIPPRRTDNAPRIARAGTPSGLARSRGPRSFTITPARYWLATSSWW